MVIGPKSTPTSTHPESMRMASPADTVTVDIEYPAQQENHSTAAGFVSLQHGSPRLLRAWACALRGTRFAVGDRLRPPGHGPVLVVRSVTPDTTHSGEELTAQVFRVHKDTQILCRSPPRAVASLKCEDESFPVHCPYNLFYDSRVLHGVVVCGPPGVGKSRLVQKRAAAHGVPIVELRQQDVFQRKPGAGEEELFRIVTQVAPRAAPCVLLIDNVEAFASSSARDIGVEYSILNALCAALDTLRAQASSNRHRVVHVVAVSSHPEAIHPWLLQTGRLDAELRLRPPVAAERRTILEELVRRYSGMAAIAGNLDSLLDSAARRGHGLVPAELEAVVRDAALSGEISRESLLAAFHGYSPALLRGVPRVSGTSSAQRASGNSARDFLSDSVGGLSEAKEALYKSLVRGLQLPATFAPSWGSTATGHLAIRTVWTGQDPAGNLPRTVHRRAGYCEFCCSCGVRAGLQSGRGV